MPAPVSIPHLAASIWRPSSRSPVMPTPPGGQPRSTHRTRPPEIADPSRKSAKNCLSPARPLKGTGW